MDGTLSGSLADRTGVDVISHSRLIETAKNPGNTSRIWNLIWYALIAALVLFLLSRIVFANFRHDQYYYLAHSLAKGRLDVDALPTNFPDIITWQHHQFIPFGPLPAVVLIPFLPALDAGLDVGVISVLVTLFNIWLLYKILGQMNISGDARRWAILLLFGGTDYFAATLVPFSTWFAQILVVTCALLAIHETLGQRRPALIGLYLGLGAMCRLTAGFALPFFIWMLWRERDAHAEPAPIGGRLLRLAKLGAGATGPLLLLLAYNDLRFGDPLQNGYASAHLGSDVLYWAMGHGLFSLEHIPKNLFMLLFQGPLPYPSADAPVLEFPYLQISNWGMGIFFTSPAMLYAFRAQLRERLAQACWLAIGCVLVPILTYYGIGWTQFGYRYALDFMPFLLLLVARGMSTSPDKWPRILITASVLVNLWGGFFIFHWH